MKEDGNSRSGCTNGRTDFVAIHRSLSNANSHSTGRNVRGWLSRMCGVREGGCEREGCVRIDHMEGIPSCIQESYKYKEGVI